MHALKIISGLVKKYFVEWVQKIRENPYLVSKSHPHNHTVPYPKSYPKSFPKIPKTGCDMQWNLILPYTFFSL